MSDAFKFGADLTPEENLRAWATVLAIDSGRFVNEDLEHAADQLAAKDAQIAALREAINDALPHLNDGCFYEDYDRACGHLRKLRAALEMSGGVKRKPTADSCR